LLMTGFYLPHLSSGRSPFFAIGCRLVGGTSFGANEADKIGNIPGGKSEPACEAVRISNPKCRKLTKRVIAVKHLQRISKCVIEKSCEATFNFTYRCGIGSMQ